MDSRLSDLCSGISGVTILVYGNVVTFENNSILYLNNALTVTAPAGYARDTSTDVYIQITAGGVNAGVVICPTPTPTSTPTVTPTITPTLTPTSTPTITPTLT